MDAAPLFMLEAVCYGIEKVGGNHPNGQSDVYISGNIMSESKIEYYIVIRFNLRLGFTSQGASAEVPKNLDPTWLDERRTLFRRYCLPSLLQQDHRHFKVLVLFDEETDRSFVDSILFDEEFLPVLVGGRGSMRRRVIDAISASRSASAAPPAPYVGTTRLDNDDALGRGYLAEVNKAATEWIERKGDVASKHYFSFPVGQQFRVRDGQYTRYLFDRNAFGTLIERWDDGIDTVYAEKHVDMHVKYDTTHLKDTEGQWCIIIHDGNVYNRMGGRPLRRPYFSVAHG